MGGVGAKTWVTSSPFASVRRIAPLPNAAIPFGVVTWMANGVLKRGSSNEGNARRASMGSICEKA